VCRRHRATPILISQRSDEDRKSDTPFARGHLGPRYLTAESGWIAF
jgi:hypothetical protein